MRPAGSVCLTTEDTEDAFDFLDPSAVTRAALALAGRAGGETPPVVRLHLAANELRLSDRPQRQQVILPASDVLRLWTACLCAAAARALTTPGVVTAGIVGPAAADHAYLALLGRMLPDLSHVALYDDRSAPAPASRGPAPHAARRAAPRSGAALSPASGIREALLGADLVILSSQADAVVYEWLSRGAVLVNATGRQLAREIYERADRLVVDDPGLRPAGPGPARGPAAPPVDLRDVLSGPVPERRPMDETVLVDLYGVGTYNNRFTVELCRAALALGLGRPCRR
ncbi:hypothetical protein ACFO3J_00635 [Streptomyces polygonati]|uniref:Ornithine cyclodeaminase n=1 Tax=Streptomyces polygonati TaxID=1617087 RepID=A0ABV8HDH9_9ACTN